MTGRRAGWAALLGRRVAAYLVDVILLAAVLLPLSFLVAIAWPMGDSSGPAVWLRSLVLVSLPAWTYFVVTDRRSGRSLGKRVLGLRTRAADGGAPGWGSALVRTAVKLAPWELTHAAFFAMASRIGEFGTAQAVVAAAAYVLLAAYLAVAARTGGARSVDDLLAGTHVLRAEAPG